MDLASVTEYVRKINKLIHLLSGEHTIRSPNGRQARPKRILSKEQILILIEDLAPVLKTLENESVEQFEIERIELICDAIMDKILFVIPSKPRGKVIDEIFTNDKKKPAVIKASFTHWYVMYFMNLPL